MQFAAIADTDVGMAKQINQDSILIKHAAAFGGEILMAMVCDGVGGLSRGELASATVIRAFAKWFEEELPLELPCPDMRVIGEQWTLLLKNLNTKILEYGTSIYESLGTTCTAALFAGEECLVIHVGDTRMYHIGTSVSQMTEDQTFVAREVLRGTMTREEAGMDKRRNMLLQCVGAAKVLEPQVICETAQRGAYLLCSDGFYHEITKTELYCSLNPVNLRTKEGMHANVRGLIHQVKMRGETDNISAVLIKAE